MLIKAYIKKHMFHLPMKESELLKQVEDNFKKKEKVNKSIIEKLYPLTKIEDNENILIEGQNTNIFLLNLLLLVLSHNEKKITDQEYYNESLIISRLEKEMEINLTGLPFEGVEKVVANYLNQTTDKPSVGLQTEREHVEETENKSYLENVQFSVNWLKEAQKELKRRE